MTEKERLLEDLRTGDVESRIYATEDILDFLDASVLVNLIELFPTEKEQIVREGILNALIEGCKNESFSAKEIYSKIYDLFSHEEAYIRNQAVVLIASINQEDVIQFMSDQYESSNKDVRKLVLDALSLMNLPASIVVLRKGLVDADINNKITAIEYLTKLKDKDFPNYIYDVLGDQIETNQMIKEVVKMAIQTL